MDQQDNRRGHADLEKTKAELEASLQRCREMLADCRQKIAANSNEPPLEPGSSGDGVAGEA